MKVLLLLLILLLVLNFLMVRPLWSAFLRSFFLLLVALFILNPVFHTQKKTFPKVAVVLDLSRSAYHLLDFYEKNLRDMGFSYELFALGDSVFSIRDVRRVKPLEGTNLNALSSLHGFDYVVFMGDGWHNAPEQVDFYSIESPVFVIMPPDDSTGIYIRSIAYPRNVEPDENFRMMLVIFSSRDTSLPLFIALADTVRDRIRIIRGENRFIYSIKAPSKEGNYSIRLHIGGDRRNLPLIVHSTRRYVLIRVGLITPEVGLLKRLIESYGLDTRILLDTVVIKDSKGQLAFIVSFFSDTSGDMVYSKRGIEGDTVLYGEGGIPLLVERGSRIFVLTDTLWRSGRRDFDAYARIMRPAIERILARKPFVRIVHSVSGNVATVRVVSERKDIRVKFNDTLSLSRTWTATLHRRETVRVEVLSSLGDRILSRSIVLSPQDSERESEAGVDSLTLALLASRTGGKLVRNASQLKEYIKPISVSRAVHPFRSIPFVLILIFVFSLEIFLRRRAGYR